MSKGVDKDELFVEGKCPVVFGPLPEVCQNRAIVHQVSHLSIGGEIRLGPTHLDPQREG